MKQVNEWDHEFNVIDIKQETGSVRSIVEDEKIMDRTGADKFNIVDVVGKVVKCVGDNNYEELI